MLGPEDHNGLALQAQTNVGFDVMELEFQGSLSGPSSDDDGNRANAPTDDGATPVNVASVQEDLEARICLPLQTLIVRDLGVMDCGHALEPTSVEDFIASYKKPLMQPILPSTPRLRPTKAARVARMRTGSRSGVHTWLPRASLGNKR
jgi:hypothetical protein